jgi:hypothetical protein
MSLAEQMFVRRARTTTRKAAHRRRRDLERELADYSSPVDRCDLEAMPDQYPDGGTHELREILAQQARIRELRRRYRAGCA